MPKNDLIVLGRLAKPYSIKGEIRVEYFAKSPLLLNKPLLLKAGRNAPRPVTVLSWRMWRDTLILRLAGVNDRNQAEAMRGQKLLIEKRHFPDPDPDKPYIRDLLDLPVFLTASGEKIGEIEDVFFPADQEIWVIRSEGGHEILFPAVPEFVDDIDLDAERISVTPPPGLLDVYLPPKA